MYECMRAFVCMCRIISSCLMIRTINTTYPLSSSYSKTVVLNKRTDIVFFCSFFFYHLLFQLVFFCLLLFICYFSSLTHVCFGQLKLNFTVITVLLWPSVFYLALVVVIVVVVKNEKKRKKKAFNHEKKITAGTIEFSLFLFFFCYTFSLFFFY